MHFYCRVCIFFLLYKLFLCHHTSPIYYGFLLPVLPFPQLLWFLTFAALTLSLSFIQLFSSTSMNNEVDSASFLFSTFFLLSIISFLNRALWLNDYDISQKHFVQYIYLLILRCFILNSHLMFHAFHQRLFYSFQAFECKHKVLMSLFDFHEEIYFGWFLVVAVMEMLCTSFACLSSVCDRQSNFVHVVQSD